MRDLHRIVRSALAMAVVAAFAFLPHTAHADPTPVEVSSVDTSHYPTVSITVTVPPGSAPLATNGFTVSDGTTTVAPTANLLPGDDLRVVLLFDTSGSMAGAPLDAAKSAAAAFVAAMPVSASVGVVAFSDQPRVVSPVTTDRVSTAAAVANLQATGETALYDGVRLALDQVGTDVGGRREIVLLSDGGDTVSRTTIDAVTAALTGAGVRLDVASLVTRETNADALNRLASASHGRVVPASDPAALTGVYGDIAASLVSQYRLTFTTAAHGDTTMRVTVGTSGSGPTTAIAVHLPPAPSVLPSPPPAAAAPAVAPVSPVTHRALGGAALAVGAAAVFLALLLGSSLVLRPEPARAMLLRLQARLPAVAGTADKARVSELAARASEAADRALARHGRSLALGNALEQAGIALRPGEFAVVMLAGGTVGLAVGFLLGGLLVGILLAVLCALTFRVFVSLRAGHRRSRFADQLVDTLQLISGALRAGYGLMQAVDAVSREAESPTREEFRRVVVETRLGRDLADSLRSAADRLGGDDFAWVVQAIEINREVGGDLAGVLDTVGATIRERNQLRRHVKALSAEGRFSAYILISLPFVIFGLVFITNRAYLSELGHGAGLVLVGVAAALMSIGTVWMRKMCRISL